MALGISAPAVAAPRGVAAAAFSLERGFGAGPFLRSPRRGDRTDTAAGCCRAAPADAADDGCDCDLGADRSRDRTPAMGRRSGDTAGRGTRSYSRRRYFRIDG